MSNQYLVSWWFLSRRLLVVSFVVQLRRIQNHEFLVMERCSFITVKRGQKAVVLALCVWLSHNHMILLGSLKLLLSHIRMGQGLKFDDDEIVDVMRSVTHLKNKACIESVNHAVFTLTTAMRTRVLEQRRHIASPKEKLLPDGLVGVPPEANQKHEAKKSTASDDNNSRSVQNWPINIEDESEKQRLEVSRPRRCCENHRFSEAKAGQDGAIGDIVCQSRSPNTRSLNACNKSSELI
ncbi:hypothetical protein YC2023_071102 [Brassica napus]